VFRRDDPYRMRRVNARYGRIFLDVLKLQHGRNLPQNLLGLAAYLNALLGEQLTVEHVERGSARHGCKPAVSDVPLQSTRRR
jgi:hypothetical protein